MAAYEEVFRIGSRVRIREIAELKRFQRDWELHNPLEDARLIYAGQAATVVDVGFYHGGDVLYTLGSIPGVWHEVCLEASLSERLALLPDEMGRKIASFPESSYGAHTVTAILDDGQRITGVVVAGNNQVVRFGGHNDVPFDPRRVIDVISEV